MSEFLVPDLSKWAARLLPKRFSEPAKSEAPSYRFLKSQVKDPVQVRRTIDWLKQAENKIGNVGSMDASTAIRLVQTLSFTDPDTALALLDQAKGSNNPDLKKLATALRDELIAEAAQPALNTLSH